MEKKKAPGDKIGYCRVSTDAQETKRQEKRLKDAGCVKIFMEKISGYRKDVEDRVELEKCFEYMRTETEDREADTFVFTELSRTTRGGVLKTLKLLDEITKKGFYYECLSNPLISSKDNSVAAQVVVCIAAAFAQEESAEKSRQIKEGQEASDNKAGRPKGYEGKSEYKQRIRARAERVADYYNDGQSISEIQRALKIGCPATVYKDLSYMGVPLRKSKYGTKKETNDRETKKTASN